MWLWHVLIFIFGTVVGSFLNVVIYRYNTGRSIVYGRSACATCGKHLHWYELIPIVSFFFQGGRCRKCAAAISWQYPYVEAGVGILFLGTYLTFAPDWSAIVYHWAIFSILAVIAVYDLRHKIIPDGFVYAFIVLALFGSTFDLDYLQAGLVLFLFFASLWYFSAGAWMGFGDAKLAVGIGFLLGFSRGISAVILGFWLGALVGLVLVAIANTRQLSRSRKSITMKTEIPFAPFLVLGVILTIIFGVNVFPF